MTAGTSPFDQLAFSGGGLRCVRQGGFLCVVRDAIGLKPARISCISGGALSAAGFICRRGRTWLDVMTDRFARAGSNIAWDTFEEDGLTPHQRIYREVIDGGMVDQAPLPESGEGATPIRLTRRNDRLPDVAGRTYLWPRDETPADKIDFTDPGKLRATRDCGAADGRRYLNARKT